MAIEYPSLDTPTAGAFRFNTDSSQLEIYDGNHWVNVVGDSPRLHTGGARGLMMGFNAPNYGTNYFNIATTGNASSYGSLSAGRYFNSSVADRTRVVCDGGEGGQTTMDYATIASTANFIDFGDCYSHRSGTGVNNSTRGVFGGGNDFSTYGFNIMEYITIQTTGNSVDFGDLAQGTDIAGGASSPTRGVFLSGYVSPANTNTIQYITTATLGNAADFGDLSAGTTNPAAAAAGANAIRGIHAGGGSPDTNAIEYITMATLGNAADFGDLTSARSHLAGCPSRTRFVACGGETPTKVNTMDYIQIMTTGNALDFGDMTGAYYVLAGNSNAHGGV